MRQLTGVLCLPDSAVQHLIYIGRMVLCSGQRFIWNSERSSPSAGFAVWPIRPTVLIEKAYGTKWNPIHPSFIEGRKMQHNAIRGEHLV